MSRPAGATKTTDTDVVIVGGGLAGVTTAVGLTLEGVDVTLVEREPRLGGRAQSWEDPETGDPVHIGPHIFLSVYPNMMKLLETLGTDDQIVWQEDHFLTITEGREVQKATQWPLPAPLHFMSALVTDYRTSVVDKLSNGPVTLYAMQMKEEDVLRLDGINAYAFLRRMGVTKNFIHDFWAFACKAIMNVPIERCSAGALMRFYKRFIGHSEFCFGFPDGGLGDIYAPAARRMLEEHDQQVLLEREVVEFLGENGRVDGVRLEDGTTITADKTVSALPPHQLRQLSPRRWIDDHQIFYDLVHFQPCPYVSSFIWFDRKLTDLKMWARVHCPNDLNCDFYDLSNIHTGWEDRPSVITSNTIYSKRAHGMTDREVVERTVDEIAEFLPEASMDRVTHWVVNRIPMAIHCPYPGTERRRPDVDAPVDNLWLAGDWTKTELPASMESACMSGWKVAEGVAGRLVGERRAMAVDHPDVEGLTGVVDRASELMPGRNVRRVSRQVRRRVAEVLAL